MFFFIIYYSVNLFINLLKGEDPKEAFNLIGVSPIDKLSIYNQLVKTSK